MAKNVCSICGYVYDEEIGEPENGISPGTKWEDVSKEWLCPLCGATKVAFEKEKVNEKVIISIQSEEEEKIEDMHELSFGELSALCSNLGKGCEKQYFFDEAILFHKLAVYYQKNAKKEKENNIKTLLTCVEENLNGIYVKAKESALNASDRGALRALVWSEKVTKILNSIISRYDKEGESAYESSNVFVCEICGFVYIGKEAPEICPVCKVPKSKITKIKRG
jgi:rubredoxin